MIPWRSARRAGRFAADLARDLPGYLVFSRRLRAFLREPLSLEAARATMRRRMVEREEHFLRMAERAIFGYPKSPYLPLLRQAGCTLGDLRTMVRTRGVEGTLRALRDAGVYLTYEEFKGRAPIVRNGMTIPLGPEDFNNPFLRSDYATTSGGSTGAGTPVPISLDNLAETTPDLMVAYDIHGVLGAPTAFWRGILPDTSGINSMLRMARFGEGTDRWFTPAGERTPPPMIRRRIATRWIVTAGRALGARIPAPEPLAMDQAAVLARWAARMVRQHGACLVGTSVSLALRVSLAAAHEGLDLTGVAFKVGSEPLTEAKERALRRSGARLLVIYAFTEAGFIGISCPRSEGGDGVHLLMDLVAVIQHPRRLPRHGIEVQPFYFTSLLPAARKILLNVETDDYGTVETRDCGCPLAAWGFTQHVGQIRSFAKLNSEGETFMGADMVRILEEVLPARFGGSPLDYQLLEEETAEGFTRLALLVGPEVRLTDEAAVVETVLNAVDRGTRATWTQARTLTVRRQRPLWTERGKFLPLVPLHLASRIAAGPVGPTASREEG